MELDEEFYDIEIRFRFVVRFLHNFVGIKFVFGGSFTVGTLLKSWLFSF